MIKEIHKLSEAVCPTSIYFFGLTSGFLLRLFRSHWTRRTRKCKECAHARTSVHAFGIFILQV